VVGNQSVMHIICQRLGPICDAIIFRHNYMKGIYYFLFYFDFYLYVEL
jgi:hypothetical protein